MLKGFKDFLLRGNIVDLAVAVVIGAAFAKVVDGMVTAIVNPLVNAAGTGKTAGLGFNLKSYPEGTDPKIVEATFLNFSTIINAIIIFVITAAVVYFVFVVPMNKINERRNAGKTPEEAAVPEDVALLTEIRDELRARR